VCLTELDIENEIVTCTCGLTRGVTLVSFRNDLTLEKGAAVHFPVRLHLAELKGTSFFFIALVSMISIWGLIGSLVAIRMDRGDWAAISNLSGWKLNILQNVSCALDQPLDSVKLR